MKTSKRAMLITAVGLALTVPAALAQEAAPGVDHGHMNHDRPPAKDQPAAAGHTDHGGADHGSMQGGSPPHDARDPHAYSGGFGFLPDRLRLADQHNFGSVLVDNLEVVRAHGETETAYDVQAWYGRTYDRLVLKAEGEVDGGRLIEARTELLWNHAVAAFWDAQLGLRYDSGEGPDRAWLALGIQGLAPYWFELDASFYLGDGGRTALRLDAEYELLLTQRLILQPAAEANLYGERDVERGLGSGLSDLTLGLRLRYEIRRQFAPYIGIERVAQYGGTADYTRAGGGDAKSTRYVAGLRLWF